MNKVSDNTPRQVSIQLLPTVQTQQIRFNNPEVRKSAKNLFRWNLVMGFLHLIQGLVMFFLSKELLTKIVWNLPKPEPITPGNLEGGRRVVKLVAETFLEINLGQAIAGFLLLSALAHFITILPKVFPWYLSNLSKRINLIRWYEYALSSSLMILVIAMLCNISDAGTLIAIVSINACMNLFGALMEMYNSKARELNEIKGIVHKNSWTAFIFGCFAGIVPWIVMGTYFFVSLSRLSNLEGLPDRFKDILNTVRFIFPALFVFFNLFAINMFLQYKEVWKWKSYIFGEKAYIILSLLAKSFLAWFIWGGTLR